jgi:flagellar assembly protein FliH
MAKILKSTGPVAKKIRRTEKSIAAFLRPDLANEPAVDIDPSEHETPMERAERMYQEAYAAGHIAGMEAGLAQFNERIGEAHQALESAGAALQQAQAAFLDALEPQIIELAKTVASRILRRESRTDIDLVRNTVRAALENLAERKHAIVRLNPADAQALTERGVSLEDLFQSFEHVEVATDESVPHGGCTIETKTVDVDARLDTQLARIFEALEE